jgi:hypothetical protein
MLYIASTAAAPLRPWHEDITGICVRPLESKHEAIRQHFSLPHICRVGSQEGCSCSISKSVGVEDFEPDLINPDKREEHRLALMARGELRALVLELLQHGPVELYTRWDGDEVLAPKGVTVMTAATLPEPLVPTEGTFVSITNDR